MNFTGAIATAKAILNFLPVVEEVVKQVEAMIPVSGKSAEKLAAANALLHTIIEAHTELKGTAVSVPSVINALINVTVAALNAAGTFKKKPAVA